FCPTIGGRFNSELLTEEIDNPETAELVRLIEMAGRSQLALVNDILDMSKIESGKFTIDQYPYSLSTLLQDVEKMFVVRAHDAGLGLVVEQTNAEAYQLLGDGQRIGQILSNLVGNAIKFTESGTVSLTTHTAGDRLFFTIKDTGIGMPPETIAKLFRRFEQADGSISRRFGGSGLGLFISLNLAEMMGGIIDVSSQERVGSIFELILPYCSSGIREKGEKSGSDSRSVLQEKLRGHILIAEDTPELRLLERRILEGMGLSVTTASDGKEAVELTAIHSFDMILMDMQMPVMDGIEACKRIKSEVDVPVVALTANVMQKHRDAFNEAGCDGFLVKPIDKQELRRVLKRHLH
ncbi:MAG: response regulator, partial [Gammaproteobacteria bacterium]|nr:response regulator [Gammaproteobacteria bacterium]